LLEHASTELEVAEADAVTRHRTQEEIAAHLGTVRDMVGRTLGCSLSARAWEAAGYELLRQ